MSSKPTPQDCVQAFQFGEVAVRLFHYAELRWFCTSPIESLFPAIVDTYCGRLRDLVEELQRFIPSRARPRICHRLLSQIENARQHYVSAWQSTSHSEAIEAVIVIEDYSENNSEDEADLPLDLQRQAPVWSQSWRTLREQIDELIDTLPPRLRLIAQMSMLIATGLWEGRPDPDKPVREVVSARHALTVTLNRHLGKSIRDVKRKFPALRGLSCDLFGMVDFDAISRLRDFHDQVLAAIQLHAAETENSTECRLPDTTATTQRGLATGPALAWQSYIFAIEKMSLSETSKRTTKRAVWEWISKHQDRSEYSLPRFETWDRYLRIAKKFHEQNRDTGLGQRTSRSIGRPEEVYEGRRMPKK